MTFVLEERGLIGRTVAIEVAADGVWIGRHDRRGNDQAKNHSH